MNTVQLIGRMVDNPEIYEMKNDNKVCNFVLCCKRNVSSDVDFVKCVAWNRNAEIIVEYVPKGRLVGIIGSLRVYRNKTPSTTYTNATVNVSAIELLDWDRQIEKYGDWPDGIPTEMIDEYLESQKQDQEEEGEKTDEGEDS